MTTLTQSVLKSVHTNGLASPPKTDIDTLNPFPPVKAIIVDLEKTPSPSVKESGNVLPERLPSIALKAEPARIPAASLPEAEHVPDTDAGRVVFLPDDRHVFHDTSFPFSLVGKVRTAVSTSSGTVVGPRHVLTASHCVNWKRDADGNIGWMSFTPSYYDGRGPWGEFQVASVMAYLENGSRLTDEQSAWDYAVCILTEPISGKVGGFAGTKVYEERWNGQPKWQSIGYPGDLFNAERPEYQSQCVVSTREPFGEAALLGHFNDTFPGQSGSPVWATWEGEPGPRIVGVVSTGPDVPQLGSTAGDNQYAGGEAMSKLVLKARADYP